MSISDPLFRTEFRARLAPSKTDDLKASVLPLIGREFTFRRDFIIDADQNYAGQWACSFTEESEDELRASGVLTTLDWFWMPEEDLEPV